MICLVRVCIRAVGARLTVILEEVHLYTYSLITAIYITAPLMPFKQTINLVLQSTKTIFNEILKVSDNSSMHSSVQGYIEFQDREKHSKGRHRCW